MNKKIARKKVVATMIAAILATMPLAGCGGDENSTSLRFWGYGDINAQTAYKAMVDAYNAGQGKTDGVSVLFSPQGDVEGFSTLIENSISTKSGPDVFFAWDRMFKKWTSMGATVDLTSYINESTAAGELDISKISKSTVDRFRYDKTLNMSEADDPIYGLPIDTSPTSLFYNKSALTDRGICVISVNEEDMDRWNANEIADNYGHKKSDFPALNGITVPKKGFFRDDEYTRKTYGKTTDIDNAILEGVQIPAQGVAMVFNDRIPMNWDEVEDIGWIMTGQKAGNTATTNYGYYTEWWFNYGWSVGGDCIEDLSGNGSWTYTHADRSANYIVAEGQTYVGEITGKTYGAGEIIEFLDKLDVEEGDVLIADNEGGYEKNGEFFGPSIDEGTTNNSITRPSVLTAVNNGTLVELPSIREAFTRFVNLSGEANVNLKICPYPTDLQSVSSIQYFTSGKLAFILECGYQFPVIEDYVGNRFEWACAPLPVFKEYAQPSSELVSEYGEKADAYNDVVERSGVQAGHSESTALVIREKSTKKDSAWKFIRWMVSEEAQRIKASYGFIPNQTECVDAFYNSLEANGKKNVKAFVEAIEYETPGDWWYMIDRDWIATWSDPLNGDVRNGNMSLAQYFTQYIARANEEVQPYGNWGVYNKVTKG